MLAEAQEPRAASAAQTRALLFTTQTRANSRGRGADSRKS